MGRPNVSIGGESPPYDNIGTRNTLIQRNRLCIKHTSSIHEACKGETASKPIETVFGGAA